MAKLLAKAPKSLGERIAAAALLALDRRIPGIPTVAMRCLQFVRVTVEWALGLGDRGFYRLVNGVDLDPSAAELETLLVKQKPSWIVGSNRIKSGDLFFWHDLPKPWGHVAILVWFKGEWWLAQNTTITNKGLDFPGYLRLIRMADMPKPSTIIRIGG